MSGPKVAYHVVVFLCQVAAWALMFWALGLGWWQMLAFAVGLSIVAADKPTWEDVQ